jgi:uncharacterized protein (DUF302 family)
MSEIDYTVETRKSFDEAVKAVEEKTMAKGFGVLHTHDVTATLAAKGFHREPLKIIEICNARYANETLEKDIRLALMLPCPISVYTERGKTFISTFRPSAIPSFFPKAGVESMAADVEKVILEIVNEAKEAKPTQQ